MRFPEAVRNRMEKVARPVDGLLLIGDAVCSFSPLYGQGITVAALEADLLRRSLAGESADVTRRFYAP